VSGRNIDMERKLLDSAFASYDEERHYDEKIDVFDETYIAGITAINKNPALTQLNVLIRTVHEVGSATRIPEDFWALVFGQLSPTDPPIVDTATQTIPFRPGVQFHHLNKEKAKQLNIPIQSVYTMMVDALNAQWILAGDGTPLAEWREMKAASGIRSSLHSSFLTTRRITRVLMESFYCAPGAISLMFDLILLYYEHSRCGKPTIVNYLNLLQKGYPYEYAIVHSMVMAWKGWSFAYRIPEAAYTAQSQLFAAHEVCAPKRPDFRMDWLLYCPVCLIVYALLDQSTSTGSIYPTSYSASKVSGFAGVIVDVLHKPVSEERRITLCPRKTGRNVAACSTTPLKYIKMAGYTVYLNQRSFTICPQRGCANRLECNPEMDRWNSRGRMCATCVFEYRLRELHGGSVTLEPKLMTRGMSAYSQILSAGDTVPMAVVKSEPGTRRRRRLGPDDDAKEDDSFDVSDPFAHLDKYTLANSSKYANSKRGFGTRHDAFSGSGAGALTREDNALVGLSELNRLKRIEKSLIGSGSRGRGRQVGDGF
jgi:hypothetical protein